NCAMRSTPECAQPLLRTRVFRGIGFEPGTRSVLLAFSMLACHLRSHVRPAYSDALRRAGIEDWPSRASCPYPATTHRRPHGSTFTRLRSSAEQPQDGAAPTSRANKSR